MREEGLEEGWKWRGEGRDEQKGKGRKGRSTTNENFLFRKKSVILNF